MRRRDVILGGLSATLLVADAATRMAGADTANPAPEEFQQRAAAWRAKALASFPYERVESTGGEAFATWQRLKAEQRGSPIVLGDDDAVAQLMDSFAVPAGAIPAMKSRDEIAASTRKILAAARPLRHPEDLKAMRKKEAAASAARWRDYLAKNPNPELPDITIEGADGGERNLTPAEILAQMEAGSMPEPPLGTWPSEQFEPVPDSIGLTVALKEFREPLPKVNIAIIPTGDWTEIPAYLDWGGWNACPPPEYHVAALRSWRDRYGIELVGLGRDTMNLRAGHVAAAKQEALALAREQYDYCADIVDQGTGTLSVLAASLMTERWWYFWWD